MKNFIHVVGADGAREVAVVDPAWDVPSLLTEISSAGKTLAAVLLTHSHHDHVNGVPDVLAARAVPVYAQAAEIAFNDELQEFGGALRPVQPGQTIDVGPLKIACLHTPGHTPGSQCFHCGGALFSGDTLFVDHCGRCDFSGSDVTAMHHSLHTVLGALPDATVLYPGHDYGAVKVSTLARERKENPYLLKKDVADFSAYRMRPR